MWLTSFMAENSKERKGVLRGCVTSSGKSGVGVMASDSHVSIPAVTPSGISSVPKKGEEAVVALLDLGEVYLGTLSKEASDLLPGEIKLFSDGASLTLKNDGRILIEGKVYLNGKELEVT